MTTTDLGVRMEARAGDRVAPDGWQGFGGILRDGDGFSDEWFPGSDFFLNSRMSYYSFTSDYRVNVKVTGRVPNRDGAYRCKIEFVHDGEPSVFSGGWIHLSD